MRSLGILAACAGWLWVLGGCNGAVGPEGRKILLAGYDAYRRGDDETAVQAASRFLRVYPRVQEASEAYYLRGLARIRSGQAEAGKGDLELALRFAKRKDLIARAHVRLGEMAYSSGDMSQAEAHFRSALANVAPDVPPADEAMYRLGCVLQRLGRWREADAMFGKVGYFFENTEVARRAGARIRAVRWSIQVGAYAGVEGARDLRDRICRAGPIARIDRERRGDRVMFLVRVGSYSTYEQARGDLERVRRLKSDAFITPAR